MGLNFGDLNRKAKSVCTVVPDTDVNIGLKIPKLGDSDIFIPKLPNFLNKALDFGKKISEELKGFELPKIKGSKLFSGLDFGEFDNRLKEIQIPTTVCLNIGGGLGLNEIFSQLSNALDALRPKVNLGAVEIPQLDLASIIPPLYIDVKLPINLNLTQTLDMIKNSCVNSILNALKGLDPFERLKQLLEMATQLCAAMQFSKLRAVIDQIQQAQMELIQQALNFITDPLAKLAKLIDMAVDALNNGAYDILEQIAGIINGVKFDALIAFLEKLDPTIAIGALIANIRQMVQLRNFGPINQLITAIQVVKARLAAIAQVPQDLLNIPELSLDALQDQINKLLDIEDFLGINALLNQVERLKNQIIDTIRALSPAALLGQLPALLQDALQKLDISQYSRLLQEAGSKLCEDIASLVPSLPDVPAVNPANVLPSAVL